MAVSPTVLLILFQSLHLYFCLRAWTFDPTLFFDTASYQHKMSDIDRASPSSRSSRVWEAANCPLSVSAEAHRRFDMGGNKSNMYQEIQLSLSPASLSFSLASPPNQFHMKAVQRRFKSESILQPVSLHGLNACLSVFTQKSSYDSDSSAPWEFEGHNRRKLPPFSYKPNVLLQEVQVSIGNPPLCYSVKDLDPNMTAVYTCSESERSSGRYPQILLRPQSPSQSRIP